MVTLKRRSQLKNGGATYSIPGAPGIVLIHPRALAEGATLPDEIGIEGVQFRQPDAEAAEKAAKREARKAELAAKVGERAEKAMERARKAQERAEKLKAQAEKAKAGGAVAAEGSLAEAVQG